MAGEIVHFGQAALGRGPLRHHLRGLPVEIVGVELGHAELHRHGAGDQPCECRGWPPSGHIIAVIGLVEGIHRAGADIVDTAEEHRASNTCCMIAGMGEVVGNVARPGALAHQHDPCRIAAVRCHVRAQPVEEQPHILHPAGEAVRGGEAVGHGHADAPHPRGEIAHVGIEGRAFAMLVPHHEAAAVDVDQHRRPSGRALREHVETMARVRSVGQVTQHLRACVHPAIDRRHQRLRSAEHLRRQIGAESFQLGAQFRCHRHFPSIGGA